MLKYINYLSKNAIISLTFAYLPLLLMSKMMVYVSSLFRLYVRNCNRIIYNKKICCDNTGKTQ